MVFLEVLAVAAAIMKMMMIDPVQVERRQVGSLHTGTSRNSAIGQQMALI